MRRLILVPLLIVVAFLAIGGGVAYVIYNNYMYYTTDDAQLNGNIVNISALATGVLAQLSVKVGDTVSAGQTIGKVTPGLPIVQLTDLSQVNVIAYVNEGAINNISNGQGVDITVDAYSGTSFSGHVQQIVQATAGQFSLLPTQDNASGNFTKVGQRVPVLITLDGTGWKDLIPGMSAEVTIHLH